MWLVADTYVLCAVIVFWLEVNSGPVTAGLAGLRALVWPLYVLTGHPKGVRADPGDEE